jgi:hypothetical protein
MIPISPKKTRKHKETMCTLFMLNIQFHPRLSGCSWECGIWRPNGEYTCTLQKFARNESLIQFALRRASTFWFWNNNKFWPKKPRPYNPKSRKLKVNITAQSARVFVHLLVTNTKLCLGDLGVTRNERLVWLVHFSGIWRVRFATLVMSQGPNFHDWPSSRQTRLCCHPRQPSPWMPRLLWVSPKACLL